MEKKFFGKAQSYYEQGHAIHTAREIHQQPDTWRKVGDMMVSRKNEIHDFMEKVLQISGLRIVFTGAGSSAFVGETMEYLLANEMELESETIHTTDIISAPFSTLFNRPTLLVSYARSGESPESLAAIDFADQLVDQVYHIIIVSDKDSSLAKMGYKMDNALVINLPEETCDVGFAMTSSVSCMAVSTWCLFHFKEMEKYAGYVELLAASMEEEIDTLAAKAEAIAQDDYRRIIWLGTGALKGLAREAAIKSMELSDGFVHAGYDAPTGFRHGPKTVLNDDTLTVHFFSNQEYSLKYDLDFAKELVTERKNNRIVTVKPEAVKELMTGEDYEVVYKIPHGIPLNSEMPAYINSLVFAQLLSMMKSMEKGYLTDNPCNSGIVNRIVQGVKIYDI